MNDREMTARLAEHLGVSLSKALSSMTGKEFAVSPGPDPDAALSDPMIWEQCLSAGNEACLWISAGRDLWTAAGQLTLAAVGIDEVTDEDCRSTWQEIISQTAGGFCTLLSADVGREIVAGSGTATDKEPTEPKWSSFNASFEGSDIWHFRIGWSDVLPGLYGQQPAANHNPQPQKDTPFSKTFDLLLDVALPVSVSFGRTSLEIREVLKLNTGSIVELNRFVAEPVEVMVNDCVIARGEVVVVDGNYGVRITQLSSREDRLKFGMTETPPRFGAH